MKRNKDITAYILLSIVQKDFKIPHHFVEILPFMQEHAIPIAQLLLVVLLPFG